MTDQVDNQNQNQDPDSGSTPPAGPAQPIPPARPRERSRVTRRAPNRELARGGGEWWRNDNGRLAGCEAAVVVQLGAS